MATLELTRANYGQQVPITRMTTLDGAIRSIQDFEGRPLVVDLWASWRALGVSRDSSFDDAS